MLQGRRQEELFWFRRRSFLQAAASVASAGSFGAWAQRRGNVVELRGDAMLNGEALRPGMFVQPGDSLETAPGASLVFVAGNAAFHVRGNSRVSIERGSARNAVSVLRMLTGAVVSVWGRGTTRQVQTPTLTAGIRGTGVYTEVFPQQGYRSYFCNCYGTVELEAAGDRAVSVSEYHQSFWAESEPRNGRRLTPARAINHTDEEVEALARLMGQRTAWEIAGRKGVHDGRGYMNEQPPSMHPAAPR
jgi:hypothetical protein